MWRHCLFCVWFLLVFTTPSASATVKAMCSPPLWDQACFQTSVSGRQLRPRYLTRVRFQKNGFAALSVTLKDGGQEILAINRKGAVVLSGIYNGDPDFREAEGGLAPFYVRDSKSNSSQCGYFQVSNFAIVIPPVYNICGHFYKQRAYVCVNCNLDCGDCHSYEYYGDQAFIINRKNEILKQIALPKIPRCSTVVESGGFPKDQPCRPGRY